MPSMRAVSVLALVGIVSVMTLGGCQSSQYDNRFVYQPRPMTIDTAVPDQPQAGSVRTLVTIVGVRRADRDADLPNSVHVRVRLDNTTSSVAEFDPRTLTLFAADVREFPNPILQPDHTLTLEPGDTATVDAFFPLPGDRVPGGMDLSGLGTRWSVLVDGHRVPGSATFSRRQTEVRYRDPQFRFGVGTGYYWR